MQGKGLNLGQYLNCELIPSRIQRVIVLNDTSVPVGCGEGSPYYRRWRRDWGCDATNFAGISRVAFDRAGSS